DNTNAEALQGGAELLGTSNIDRLNADRRLLEICLTELRREAEARPIGGSEAVGRGGRRHDIAALNKPRERLLDLVGRKPPAQLARELAEAVSAFGYCCCKRAVEFAVEKKLPGLGIEAHHVGGLNIDSEVRRKLRNFFAVAQCRNGPGSACHKFLRKRFD